MSAPTAATSASSSRASTTPSISSTTSSPAWGPDRLLIKADLPAVLLSISFFARRDDFHTAAPNRGAASQAAASRLIGRLRPVCGLPLCGAGWQGCPLGPAMGVKIRPLWSTRPPCSVGDVDCVSNILWPPPLVLTPMLVRAGPPGPASCQRNRRNPNCASRRGRRLPAPRRLMGEKFSPPLLPRAERIGIRGGAVAQPGVELRRLFQLLAAPARHRDEAAVQFRQRGHIAP